MDGAIAGASAADARIIYGDNLYMYGPVSECIREDMPYAATGRKGCTRARVADKLMNAHASGEVKAVIGRAADFYGPRVLSSSLGERIFPRALRSKTAEVVGNPDMPHTYTFIRDFARGLVTLGERKEALGEIWHLPSAETLTTRQIVELVFEIAGTTPRIRAASPFIVKLMGLFNPMMRELTEVLYQFTQPFVVDHSKYAKAFGAETTPHDEAIRETLEWYIRNA
jgi:nucleoside-diphosphate-sugar epimerase